ncbi:unnamed protein product [Trichobilharzia szidati]|nr:unnamed protein product [Trichobilharzia szidati]
MVAYDTGNCRSQSADYCESRIQNSVCHWMKDECFCRMGYVAIRENDEIVCRTLLTDLSCRVDSDCVHVDFSVCHPGAGKCICPGNTIYVAYLHACRNKLFHQNYDACNICGSNYVCHEVFEKDLQRMDDVNAITIKLGIIADNTNSPAYIGCSCTLEHLKQSANISFDSKLTRVDRLCSINLPDIGEVCGHSGLVCRSRNAQCSNSSHKRICTCPANTIPVYQNFLDYFECFPIMKNQKQVNQSATNLVADECEPCQKINGTCYDQNNDGIADGCQCPPNRSFGHVGDRRENARNKDRSMNLFKYNDNLHFPCEVEHIKTDCNEGQLTICYFMHTLGRFKALPYQIRLNMTYVSLVQLTYAETISNTESCLLTSSTRDTLNTLNDNISFSFKSNWLCTTMPNDQSFRRRCGVDVHNESVCSNLNDIQNIHYSGNVYIRQVNKNYENDKTLLEIPWRCTTKTMCKSQKKLTKEVASQSNEYNLEQLSVLNSNNELVTEMNEGELVHLQLVSNYKIVVISTEMCVSASLKYPENLIRKVSISSFLHRAFYHFKCHATDEQMLASYNNQTIVVSDLITDNENRTSSHNQRNEEFFVHQIIAQQNVVYYICLIPSLNDSVNGYFENALRNWCQSSSEQRLLRTNDLFIAQLTIKNPISSHQAKCTLLSCLTMNQLTYICCSLLLMNFIVCVILILMFKHKQQLTNRQQYKSNQKKNLPSQKLLNDSSTCPMCTASTPQEISPMQQQSVYYNELGTYFKYEDQDDFDHTVNITYPACTTSDLSHYQSKRCMCTTAMESSTKHPSNRENLVFLTLPHEHSVKIMQKCRQNQISEINADRFEFDNFDI